MHTGKIGFIFLFLAFAAGTAAAEHDVFTAEIFLRDSDQQEPLFSYTSKVVQDRNLKSIIHSYFTPENELFAEETVSLKSGKFYSHTSAFPVFEESSLLVREGDSLIFTYTKKGRTRSRTFPFREYIYGPTRQDFFNAVLPFLLEGETIAFELPFPQMLNFVEFRIYLIENSPFRRPGTKVLEMRTRSLLLRMFAKPIQYVLDEETGLILEIHGPTTLRRRVGKRWEFFDGSIYFRY